MITKKPKKTKSKTKKKKEERIMRAFSVDVYIPSSHAHDPFKTTEENERLKDEEKLFRRKLENKIVNSLLLYRSVCRKIFNIQILADCVAANVGYRMAALLFENIRDCLSLSKDQKSKVKAILAEHEKALDVAFRTEFVTPSEVLARIGRSVDNKLKDVLDADQFALWKSEDRMLYFYSVPQNEESKKILEDLFAIRDKQALFYSMRSYVLKYLAPDWKSATWDSARLVTEKVYKSKHPIKLTSRCWDILQQVSDFPRMERVPLTINFRNYTVEKHKITFGWDYDIGDVTFNVGKLDGGRWALWNDFANGKLKAKQVELTYEVSVKKGKQLKIRVSYEKEAKIYIPEKGRSMEVNFDAEGIKMFIRDGKIVPAHGLPLDELKVYPLSFLGAVDAIDEIKRLDEKLLAKLRSCGSFREQRRGEGVPKAAKRYQRSRRILTERRDRRVKDWNHRWTKKIIANAEIWRCERIVVFDVPEKLNGRPWQWFAFKFDLTYKAEEKGCKVEFLESPKAEDVVKKVIKGSKK